MHQKTRGKDRRGEIRMLYKLLLQQFAEAGDASQAAAGSGEGTEQAAAANETKASFEDLIKGDYKDDYEKAVTKIVRQRFAGAKANEDKLAKMAPIMEALASKYGADVNDLDSIAKFVDEDESLYEDAAYKAGMTVDQYKRFSRIEAENQRLTAEREANEQRRAAQAQYEAWLEEAEQIKAEFPKFDLNVALQNEDFQRLLRNRVDLRTAYVACDLDNILPDVMAYTAQQVARKTSDTIARRGNRPMEGGMSGQASAKAGTDVSKLSANEIADLVRRATAGERISFA